MTFDDFISTWNGKGCDYDHYFGFQCVDLADQYAQDVVGVKLPLVPGAADFWNLNIDGYDKIPNSPTGVPSKGDIIIWGSGVGPNGHIAIFVSGDANNFTSLDQNWPIGSLCHLQSHNYTNVLGWFHPKQVLSDTISVPKADFEKLVSKSTKYDSFVSGGFSSIDDVTKKIEELNKQISDLQKALQEAQNTPLPIPPAPTTEPPSTGPSVPSEKILGNVSLWNGLVLRLIQLS